MKSANVKGALTVIQVILAVLVILGVLLQTPRATGLGGTIGGSGGTGGGYRRRRGLEQKLLQMTGVFIGLFLAASTFVIYLDSH